ncbi:hypothetical protein [Agrobacterium radiobacter]|uniref:hypothetical protein n=1 Tax=Agrobacterium radiobacter TaxID=362 RepID=UPI003CE59D44
MPAHEIIGQRLDVFFLQMFDGPGHDKVVGTTATPLLAEKAKLIYQIGAWLAGKARNEPSSSTS